MLFKDLIQRMSFVDYCLAFGSLRTKDDTGIIAYRPWDFWTGVNGEPGQLDVAEMLETTQVGWVPKARQKGISEIVSLYLKYTLEREAGSDAKVISAGTLQAKEFLEKRFQTKVDGCLALYPDVPWLKWEIGKNRAECENGSYVQILSSDTVGARGGTPRITFLDEAREQADRDFREILASVFPVLRDRNQFFIVSSGAPGSPFNERVKKNMEWPSEGSGRWRSQDKKRAMIFLNDLVDPIRRVPGTRETELKEDFNGDTVRFNAEYPLCVTGDTRISTENGIVQIKDAEGHVETESGKISRWIKRPSSPVYKVSTKCGRELTGTRDHPIKLFGGGFCKIGDLKSGEKIELRAPRLSETQQEIVWCGPPSVKHSVVIDEDWGLFLGYFMGDGSYHNYTLSVVTDFKDKDSVEIARALIERMFGSCSERHLKSRGKWTPGAIGSIELRCGCVGAKDVLDCLGAIRIGKFEEGPAGGVYRGVGAVRRNVCVPEVIFRSPKNVVRQFLMGLFESDGSPTESGVTFASNKLKFIQDVQLLLLAFEIPSYIRISHRTDTTNRKKYVWYKMQIGRAASRKFMQEIGFICARKSVRTYEEKPKSHGGRKQLPVDFSDEVLSVELTGEQETYDLTVEGSHVFSANGILTHNCITDMMQSHEGLVIGSLGAHHFRPMPMLWERDDKTWNESYIVYDHGSTKEHPALAWFCNYDRYADLLYVYDELYLEGKELPEISKEMLIKLRYWKSQGVPMPECLGDVAGKQGTRDIASIIRDETKALGMTLNFNGVIKTDKAGSLVLLQNRFFHNRIIINPKCVNTRAQLEGWRYELGTDKPSEAYDEAGDVGRYLCNRLIKGDPPKPKSYEEKQMDRVREWRQATQSVQDGKKPDVNTSWLTVG